MTTPPVTESHEQRSPLSSGENTTLPVERGNGPEVSTLHPALHRVLVAVRHRLVVAAGRSRGYWLPPRFLTERPPTVAQMTEYARRAGWAASTVGLFRAFGVVWLYVVAVPWAAATRAAGWLAERPGRALLFLAVYQFAARSEPGVWAADHLIRPLLAVAGWVFLP